MTADQWKAANPRTSFNPVPSVADYDQMAIDRAAMVTLDEQRQATDAADATKRTALRNRIATLEAGAATPAQVQAHLADLTRQVLRLRGEAINP